jgi:acyl carrier protein
MSYIEERRCRMSTAARVTSLIGKQTLHKPEVITGEHNLRDDLDFDSLDILEVGLLIEEEFDIELADNDLKDVETVADLTAKVDALLARKGGG